MPHVRTTTKEVWKFSELNDSAKDRARDWFRQGNLDHDWWEFVYEDAETCGAILGIEMDHKTVRTMGGTTRPGGPTIWFSGFSSQGDGACFEGRYSYAKLAAKKISDHTGGTDKELIRIAGELQGLQRKNFYRLTARMKHSGHYYHSGCMTVDVDDSETRREGWLAIEEELTRLMRDFADWIYSQLEKEHDYLQSDEQVDESIRANEYGFDESGRPA